MNEGTHNLVSRDRERSVNHKQDKPRNSTHTLARERSIGSEQDKQEKHSHPGKQRQKGSQQEMNRMNKKQRSHAGK